jgi:hypothetical protein
MKERNNLLLIIPLAFMILGCKKNEKDEVARKDLLCEPGKHYILTAKTVYPALCITRVGYDEYIPDLFDRFCLCQEQVLMNGEYWLKILAKVYFYSDGTYSYDDYALNCSTDDSLVLKFYHPYICNAGTWTLNADESFLTMTTSKGEIITSKIEKLTSSDTETGYLILSNEMAYKNVKYLITSTYIGVYSFW